VTVLVWDATGMSACDAKTATRQKKSATVIELLQCTPAGNNSSSTQNTQLVAALHIAARHVIQDAGGITYGSMFSK
jgi:hypothetical protein